MKIFSADQIRAWDAFTIANEPIASSELMNRAARVFTEWFTTVYPDPGRPIVVLAGTGNNGGDGVAAARLLNNRFYSAKVFVCDFSGRRSADFEAQTAALPPHDAVPVHWLRGAADRPAVPPDAVVIEALFGSGLNRAPEGEWSAVIGFLNTLPNEIVSIDLPGGLFADGPTPGPVVCARRTFSFQQPKRAFFFPENADRVGEWTVGDIGLHPGFEAATFTPYYFLEKKEVQALLRPRPKFSHKGTFGHALLVAGSPGKTGAAVLATRACLRSGAGLTTLHAPATCLDMAPTAIPEAMTEPEADRLFDELGAGKYTALGIGPGIGTDEATEAKLGRLLRGFTGRGLALDADALNLLARRPDWWALLPENTLLTPHPKEFERLFGPSADDFARNELLRQKAREHRVVILLKGAYSAVATPDGACYFNSTGNPGMATGGSGDVLTGLLTGLLASGYPPAEAMLLGVYLHGLAGDLAAAKTSQPGLTAGDLVDALGPAWLALEK